jgi:hypothetical protein
MQVKSSTISLTVADVAGSVRFFTEHLGYREQMAAEGFASLSRDDGAVDVVFLQQGIEVLPEDQRDRHASGLSRLQGEGVSRCPCRRRSGASGSSRSRTPTVSSWSSSIGTRTRDPRRGRRTADGVSVAGSGREACTGRTMAP